MSMTPDELPVRFSGATYRHRFRRYQGLALDAFDSAVADGHDRAYLVLPPGAGKTAVGLEAARRLGRPTLVLTPNSAIQAQWVAQWDDFQPQTVPAGMERDLADPLTVLTYQALCTIDAPDDPLVDDRSTAERREAASDRRRERTLLARGGDREALLALLHPNGRALIDRMKGASGLGFSWTLVLDECHHLLELWGWLVSALVDELAEAGAGPPFVIGLTATPPGDLTTSQAALHERLFGDASFAVATPAVVKEGHLAPYRELVRFTTPLPGEAAYIADEATRFAELRTDLLDPTFARTGFLEWLQARVVERRTPEGVQLGWERFERDDPDLARAALRLHVAGLLPLPEGARVREEHRREPDAEDWVALISDYAVGCLAPSEDRRDVSALDAIRKALPAVGWRLTRNGVRAGATPVDRVLARSASKSAAALEILGAESDTLGDRLRAVVLCDFESAGAELPARLVDVIDPQSGGARLLLELLIADGATRDLDPVLVTGRSVACSRATATRLIPWLAEHAPGSAWPNPMFAGMAPQGARARADVADLVREWMGGGAVTPAEPAAAPAPPVAPGGSGWWEPPDQPPGQVVAQQAPGVPVAAAASGPWAGRWELPDDVTGPGLPDTPVGNPDDIVEVAPIGGLWPPRRYVPLLTRFFEEGGSRCLVGTRSLLGEGWDAKTVNVMVDLSAAATPTSVHQMRGRALRLDPAWPEKVAHNWAVVCVAEGHPKGDADYDRFVRKHRSWFALAETGAIESGVACVDAALSPWAPPEADAFAAINTRMLVRAGDRAATRARWAIGEPYENVEAETVRIRHGRPLGLPGSRVVGLAGDERPARAWGARAGVVAAYGGLGAVTASGALPVEAAGAGLVLGTGALVLAGLRRAGGLSATSGSQALEDLAAAVADGLRDADAIGVGAEAVEVVPEPDGMLRCQLGRGATAAESRAFAEALEELLAPIASPRYVIPRRILDRPAGTGAALGLVARRALGLGLHGTEAWHAVPSWLGANKDRVAVFNAAWNRHVSPGAALFTGSPEGAGIVTATRGDDPFAITTQLRTLWR